MQSVYTFFIPLRETNRIKLVLFIYSNRKCVFSYGGKSHYSCKYHHVRVKYETRMTTSAKKLRPQASNNLTLTKRLINDEGILPTDETIIAETSDSTRFHTLCKRVFRANPGYFPSAAYHGKTIFFCTETCLDAFLADPERFYCAHSQPASRK